MSYPNYVDFDYWDYQYAEGDTRSVQDVPGLITANGYVIASPYATYSGVGNIAGSGLVGVHVSNFRPGAGTINGTGTLSTDAIRVRTSIAPITATSTVSASGEATYSGVGTITSNGELFSVANYTVSQKGNIASNANVDAVLYRIGEEWVEIPAEDNEWHRIG